MKVRLIVILLFLAGVSCQDDTTGGLQEETGATEAGATDAGETSPASSTTASTSTASTTTTSASTSPSTTTTGSTSTSSSSSSLGSSSSSSSISTTASTATNKDKTSSTTEEAVYLSQNVQGQISTLTEEMKHEIMELLVNYFSNNKKTTTRRPYTTSTSERVTNRPYITGVPIVPNSNWNGGSFGGSGIYYPGYTDTRYPEIGGNIVYPQTDGSSVQRPAVWTNGDTGSRTDFNIPRVPGMSGNNRYHDEDNSYNSLSSFNRYPTDDTYNRYPRRAYNEYAKGSSSRSVFRPLMRR